MEYYFHLQLDRIRRGIQSREVKALEVCSVVLHPHYLFFFFLWAQARKAHEDQVKLLKPGAPLPELVLVSLVPDFRDKRDDRLSL